MQILVISDTHGRSDRLRQAVLMHENADYIIHCGDGERECDELLSEIPALAPKLYFVRGNCDHSSRSPELMTLDLPFSHRAVITHGHRYLTGSFRENLVRLARSQDADIVLFGHIHTRVDETLAGVRLFSPGSAALPRDGQPPAFGLIDVFESGFLTSHGSLGVSPYTMQ